MMMIKFNDNDVSDNVEENIKLLGEGYSNISFSCYVSEDELDNGKKN